MPYFVAKTGLEIFDLCRAYGLAALLDKASPEEHIPVIHEAGSFYKVEHPGEGLSKNYLINNTGWHQLFVNEPGERVWNCLFLTDKNNWPKKVERVKKILNDNFDKIIKEFQNPSFLPQISSNKGETLSGPLDPSAFKGLRGKTRGDYGEGQTKVDSQNWAVACLGGAIAGRYKIQKAQGNKWNYFVTFPVPEKIEFNNFREIKEKTHTIGLQYIRYISAQNAAAHFSVCLAQKMRELASSKSQFSDRFSGVFYFSMIQSGQQFKPFSGGNLSLYPLMELAYSGNPDAEKVFEVWDYLFRKGSVKGCEDLGVAITDFIMHPTLETYEKHALLFLRYMIRGEVKSIHYYTEKSLREVINYVD